MSSHDDRTEARVRTAFEAELRRAESDLELSPLILGGRSGDHTSAASPKPRRHRALTAGLLTAATAAVVIATIGAGLLVAGVRNTGPAASSSSVPTIDVASPSATPVATSSIPRFSDGIPRTFESEPVLRWADALAMRAAAKDATPFFVGVWLDVTHGLMSCPASRVDPSAPYSWVRSGCTGVTMSAEAGAVPDQLDNAATFRFTAVANLSTGPAILRVHLHDSRAAQCGYQQAICDDMVVVDYAVWTGDAATAPSPLSVADVIAAARSIEPSTSLEVPAMTSPTYDGGGGLTDSVVLAPVDAAEMPGDMEIAGAYLMPSVEAMRRALPNVQPGAAGTLLQSAYLGSASGSGPGYAYFVAYRWLLVDNVAFSVRVASPPTDADEAWLTSIVAALDAHR